MSEFTLTIATEFSDVPGLRYESQGPNSGARFRDGVLLPRFQAARQAGQKLIIFLDGVEGYTTSFLEEAFGGLARINGIGIEAVLETIEARSVHQDLLDDVDWYVRMCNTPPQLRPERPLPQRQAS